MAKTKNDKDNKNSTIGRPPVITPEVVSKLEQEFAQGLTDDQACLIVGVSRAALNRYCAANEDFRVKKEALKQHPTIKAKKVVNDKINEGDAKTARWLLERKAKDEFSTRSEITGKDGEDLAVKTTIIVTEAELESAKEDLEKEL